MDKVDVCRQAEQAEGELMYNISFCPTISQVDELIIQDQKAQKTCKELKKEENKDWRADKTGAKAQKLISKLYHLAGKVGLCPDSLDPDDTILCKLGRGDIPPGGTIGDNSKLTCINDLKMPFGGASLGPNIVLTDCNGEDFGPGRINLFYGDRAATKKLVDAVINMRNENFVDIFRLYVEKLKFFRGPTPRPAPLPAAPAPGENPHAYKLDPTKDDLLEETYRVHYDNVCDMMELILLCAAAPGESAAVPPSRPDPSVGGATAVGHEQLARGGEMTLKNMISVTSFCQTWLRNGGAVGEAQFSVMSPHFQTKFWIRDCEVIGGRGEHALCIFGITSDMLESYRVMTNKLKADTQIDYGVGGGGQAFINIDDLQELLEKNP
jgi:hypothetical protein